VRKKTNKTVARFPLSFLGGVQIFVIPVDGWVGLINRYLSKKEKKRQVRTILSLFFRKDDVEKES